MNIKKLKELRAEKKLSQHALAIKIGLHTNYIAHLEQGMRDPSVKTLIKIADALDVDPGELIR